MVSLHRYIRDSVYNIKIGEETIQATADHPFFISGHWLRVAELKVGDSVKAYDGSNLAIEQITVAPGRTTVYNFEVEDYHTYYVSNTKVLVHNNGPCDVKIPNQPPPNLSPKGAGRRGAFREAKRAEGIPNSEYPTSVEPARNKAGNRISCRDYKYINGKTVREHWGHDYPNDPIQNRGNHFNDSNGNHYDY